MNTNYTEEFDFIAEQALLNNDIIFNTKDAAVFLNLSKSSIYNLTSNNDIPFYKRGRKIYFLKSQLINWLKNSLITINSDHKELAFIEDQILTLTEAAAFLQVPPTSIKTISTKYKFLFNTYNFPAIYKGEDIFFQKNELAVWLMEIGRRDVHRELEAEGLMFNLDKP